MPETRVNDLAMLYAFIFAKKRGEDIGGKIEYEEGRAILVMTPNELVKFSEMCEGGEVGIALAAAQELKRHLTVARIA